jgi:hypothetical protein
MFVDLCKEHNADKGVVVAYYDRYFWSSRLSFGKVLEMGSSGASMRMFKDAFCNATIYAVDIAERTCAGVHFFKGDYMEETTQQWIKDNGPYDLIIDDADHEPVNVISVFNRLHSCTKQYVIEDAAVFCLREGLESFYAGFAAHMMHMQTSRKDTKDHREDVRKIHTHGIEDIIIHRNFMLFNMF